MNIIFTYIVCTLVVILVNLKIFGSYQSFEAMENDLAIRSEEALSKILVGEISERELKLKNLVEVYADRELELYMARFYMFLSMGLFTLCIYSVPVTQQLKRRSKMPPAGTA